MQIVQQIQESLVPYVLYKVHRIVIRTHYFAINTGTDHSCVSEQMLLRGEVEKAKAEYQVLSSSHFCYRGYIHSLCSVLHR